MKLVFIHGPPAVGKLTVAEELSKIIGFKVFHNHLSLDLVDYILKPDNIEFWKLVTKIRLEIFKTASENNINLIFTYGDVASDNFKFVKRVIKTTRNKGGKVCFVHLVSEKEELYKRVANKLRKKFNKITSLRKLKNSLDRWDFNTSIPFVEELGIDNTDISAKEVAYKIKKYYRL